MSDILLSQAYLITFTLVDTYDMEVDGLGTTFVVEVSQNGGAFQAGTGTKAEISDGWYSYELTVAETDTAGPLSVKITGAGVRQRDLTYQVGGFTDAAIDTSIGYCTLAELKARIGITDTADDAVLAQVITAVSRQIDAETHRRFFTTVSDEIRYETADYSETLYPHIDIISITTLQTDNDTRTYPYTWAATDYDLLPANASLDGIPYSWIETAPGGTRGFPFSRNGVKITGKFGWASVPGPVHEACLLQCERIFHRKDAPFGVAGSPEIGMLRLKAELDPDVQRLLAPYKKWVL